MKTLLLALLLMLSAGYVMAANEDIEEVRQQCTEQGKDEGLSGDELSDYVATCIAEKTGK